jgi:hypothetical protein
MLWHCAAAVQTIVVEECSKRCPQMEQAIRRRCGKRDYLVPFYSKLPCFRGLGERLPGTCLLGWNPLMKRTCQLARCTPAHPFILVKLSSEKLPQKSAQTILVCAEKCGNYFSLRRKVRKLF